MSPVPTPTLTAAGRCGACERGAEVPALVFPDLVKGLTRLQGEEG